MVLEKINLKNEYTPISKFYILTFILSLTKHFNGRVNFSVY